jgi:hypothetical protein
MATSKRKNPDKEYEEGTPPSPEQPPDAEARPELKSTMPTGGKRYVVFDQTTGAVVGTYGHLSAATGEFHEQTHANVLKHFGEVRRTAKGGKGAAAPALGVIEVEAAALAFDSGGLRVDPKAKRLVPKPRLQLSADRTAIAGDGKDSVEITVTAVDADEKTDAHFAEEVRVTTNHGRLSERGGLVTLRKGVAHITLTSTPETIARVTVTARDEQRLVASGVLDLEFL